MRKLKLLMTMLILLVGGVSFVNAQNWTGNAPAAGVFYLYNVGQQKFLTSGNWWGTHAALDTDGMAVTLAGNGPYTISTSVAFSDKYLGDDEYVDNGTAASWTFEKVGDTDKYTMKTGNNYFVINANGVPVNSAAAPTTDAGYWQLVTRQQLIDNLNYATPENPIDASFYMTNPKVRRNWPKSIEGTGLNDNGSFHAGVEGLYNGGCASYGQWHKTFDNYQALTGVKNGKYKVRVKGVNRIDDGDNVHIPYLYANDQKGAGFHTITESNYSGLDGSNAAEKVTHLFVDDTYLLDWLEVTVTDGNLRVGVKSDANVGWATFAQFTIMFVDPFISSAAIELPANGAIEADTWYKYTVAVTGNYSISATTAANIIQTTSGNQLKSVATGSALVTGDEVALTAGDVIYYKSSTANALTIEANIKTYTVGDVTATSIANNTYIQSLTSVTFTLGEAASNDGTASLAIQGTPVAKLNDGSSDVADGALSIEDKVVTATFTSVNLDPAKTYTITLPANAVAWDKNTENKNTAKVITFNTPAVFDGVYYMYNTDTKNYISRAGNYNTQAIMDNYGLAFNVSTDTENNTKLQYFDSELWLGDDGFCYGDCTDTRIRTYNITKVAEGYKFLNTNNSKYLAVYDGQTVGDAVEGGNLQGTSNVWNLENTAAHVANYTTNANKQATDVATAASLAGITTKAALDTELEANYIAIPVTVTGAKAEKYEDYPGNNKDSGPVAYHSETVNLTPGLYKLSVDAFQRATTNEKVFAADGARGLICLYAGAVKTQIKSVSEYGSNSQYASTDYAYNGKYYPNREATGYQALETGNYKNEVYFYVAETSDVEIGIQNASRPGNNCGTWSIYNNWTLTRYISASTTESVTVTPAGYATYVSTLPLDYTSTEIKAYTAKANDGKIVLTQINKVPANTPVVLYKEGGATEAIPVATTTDTPAASDLVAGTGAAVATEEGDYTNYILNIGSNGIGFYLANSQTVEANRAYMHVSNSEKGSESRMAIVFDDQATGIADLKAAAKGDAIYNLNGQRIEKATKGVYIIDGKKIIMK